jgi:dienelactone hydrolase
MPEWTQQEDMLDILMKTMSLVAVFVLLVSQVAFAAEDDGPPLRRDLNEQVLMLPVKTGPLGFELETTLYKPDSPGPFPLVVINHGKKTGETSLQERQSYPLMAQEFLKRGYLVVVPMRRGYSKSSGKYDLVDCNITQWARDQADDVIKVIELLRARPDVDGSRILVIGQSIGGLVALAQAERNVTGVRAILSFAAGIYWPDNSSCDLETARNEIFTYLGADAKVDSLWFHGEEDAYTPAEIAAKLYQRYQATGGRAELVRFAAPQNVAHGLFGTRQNFENIWWPKAEPFLKAHGLPSAVISQQYVDPPRPKASGYANSPSNFTVLPTRDEGCKSDYRKFVYENVAPRAFAFSADGACGWAANSDDPSYYALRGCKSVSKQPCQLYLVDDVVVWPKGGRSTARHQ